MRNGSSAKKSLSGFTLIEMFKRFHYDPACFCMKLPLLLVGLVCALHVGFPQFVQAQTPGYKVLVFSATAGYRHASIPDGIAAIQSLGANNNFAVDATEDATLFTDANLAQYKAIIFLCTTGDVLTNAQQQAALQQFVRAGRGRGVGY